MLSIVAPIPSVIPFPASSNPFFVAQCPAPGISLTSLGKGRFRLAGESESATESEFTLHFSDGVVTFPVFQGERCEHIFQKLQRNLPEGYRAFSRMARDGSVEFSVLRVQPSVVPLPVVVLTLSDTSQSTLARGSNAFEILGIASGIVEQSLSGAHLLVDGHSISLRLRKGMTPADTARALIAKLPAGYHAALETSRIPGSPAVVSIVRGAGVDKAAA